jgi:hypothetical protein
MALDKVSGGHGAMQVSNPDAGAPDRFKMIFSKPTAASSQLEIDKYLHPSQHTDAALGRGLQI